MTEGIRLRPVVEAELDPLEAMVADPESIGEFNWNGFGDPMVWRKRFADNGLLADEMSVLIIDLAGEMIGFVSWHRVPTGTASFLFEFGISLLPRARGQGHGTTAQLLLARYLFNRSPINRIQAYTEFDHIAEQRSLEKAGFVREAVLRGVTFRAGAWRDEVLYRMLRDELPR